jgi:hypothetical protein
VAAWKDAQQQITDFNALLTKNQLQALTLAPIKVADATCSPAPEGSRKAGKVTTTH